VFGHDDVSVNAKDVILSNPLQRRYKHAASARTSKPRPPTITTESEEVDLTRLLESLQSPRHNASNSHKDALVCDG
jgi:hypothetical protein